MTRSEAPSGTAASRPVDAEDAVFDAAPVLAPARALAASRRRPSARANWRSASQSRGLAGTGRSASGTAGIAIRALGDWLVVHQVLSVNPAAAVRGPKHVVTKGTTPVLTPAETRSLLDRIDPGPLVGLRDRALLSVLVYSFARVSAAVGMRRQDYFRQGLRARVAEAAREVLTKCRRRSIACSASAAWTR